MRVCRESVDRASSELIDPRNCGWEFESQWEYHFKE